MAVIEQTAPQSRNSLHSVSTGRGKLALPVVLYLIAVMLPIGFNLGPIYLNLIRLVLLATIIPLTVQLLSGKFGGILIPDVFFFLHVFWIIIAITVNDPNRAFEYVGSTAIEFIGSYVLARAYIRTSEDFLLLSRALVLMIVLMLPFGLYELFTNDPPILRFLQKIPGIRTEWVVSGYDMVRMGLFRVQGTLPHPIHFGIFVSFGFVLCFIGLKGIYGPKKRYFGSGLIVLCTFLSLSSGALLPLMLQVGLILWAKIFDFTRYRWLILAVLIGTAYIVVDILSNRTPIMVFISYATFSPGNAYYRFLIFEYGMDNVWANPWLGIGITGDWVRPEWMHASTIDNFWLVIAMRYGIPGLLLLAIGFFQPLWPIGRRNFDSDQLLWQQRRAWMFLFIGLSLALATVHVWTTLFSFVFFMFGAGMFFLTIEPNTREMGDASIDGDIAKRITLRRSIAPVLARKQSLESSQREFEDEKPSVGVSKTASRVGLEPRYTRFPINRD